MALTAGPAWLFCPADRPERFEKAAAAADVVILDLEDGVAAKDRAAAREALVTTPLDPTRTVVRVNPAGTDDHELDLAALAAHALHHGDAGQDRNRPNRFPRWRRDEVIVLIETPLGALNVVDLARGRTTHTR